MRIRLIALDLDGTALDPTGRLGTGMSVAVAEARARGLSVVLCTGRRFRTALPSAQALGLEGAIVIHNGVLVKDLESAKTLHQDFLPPAVFGELLGSMREFGPPLVYVDGYHDSTDIVTERVESAHPFQREYLADNTEYCRVVEDLGAARPDEVIMMSAMGDADALEALRDRTRRVLGDRVHTHSLMNKNYRGQILEFLSPTSGKWPAVRRVAAAAGIGPEQIAAIGDDFNDLEMIRESGLGIAMANAVEPAREAADWVVPSNADGGGAFAIERVLQATR